MNLQDMMDARSNRRRGNAGWRNRENYNLISGSFLETLNEVNVAYTDRDRLIQLIIEADELQKEMFRRLVIRESRLDILVKFLGYDLKPHHAAFVEFLRRIRARGGKRGFLLAPRGCGKSTICNTCYGVLRLLQDPNESILIGSRTMTQAKEFLGAIKGNFEKEQMVTVFGDLKGKKWDELAIDIIGREPGTNEHSVQVAGADGGGVTSKHFSIIIADDLVDEKNSKSDLQRDNVKTFYSKTLIPTLKAGGELWVYGTKYHPEDFYTQLEENDPSFRKSFMIYPGIFDVETGEPTDLEQQPDGSFRIPVGSTVWDEEDWAEEICERRASMSQGDFETQYQNRSDMLRGDYFDSDWFQYYDEPPERLVIDYNLRVWTGVDLAISEDDENDEFAVVTVGIEPKTFHIYVLDYFSGRFSFDRQLSLVQEAFETWEPVKTYIESNAYQAALQQCVVRNFPEVRAFKLFTSKDKITRAAALSAYYELGKVHHRRHRSAKLEGQLTAFPYRKLKDLFDALYFAVWGAMRGGRRGRKRTREPGLL